MENFKAPIKWCEYQTRQYSNADAETQRMFDSLKNYETQLTRILHKNTNDYCFIATMIAHIKKDNLYTLKYNEHLSHWYDNLYDYCKFELGFVRATVDRLLQVYDRFVDGYKCKSEFENYSISKLFELVSVSDNLLDNFNPSMTLKEIKDLKKYLCTAPCNDDFLTDYDNEEYQRRLDEIENNLPRTFDKNNLDYEYSYFETLSKAQLLTNIWDIYQAYVKLKKGGKK